MGDCLSTTDAALEDAEMFIVPDNEELCIASVCAQPVSRIAHVMIEMTLVQLCMGVLVYTDTWKELCQALFAFVPQVHSSFHDTHKRGI